MPRWYIVLFFILLVGNILVFTTIFGAHDLQVTVLDVSKGNAALIHTPKGETILIDTGTDASILRALGTALSLWQRRIDLVILTSTKATSVGGLPSIAGRYRISNQVSVGDSATPYGTHLTVDDTVITITAPATATISYHSKVFSISSSTPKGIMRN